MSQVNQVRSGTVALSNVYEKVATEGDATNFLGANPGFQQLFRATEDTTSSVTHSFGTEVTDVASVTDPYGNTLKTYDFALDFSYLVGAKQLMVSLKARIGVANPDQQPAYTYVLIPSEAIKDTDPSFSDEETWYEEIDSSTVRVHNLRTDRIVMCFIPHTAVAAVSKEKITVKNQGNNEAIELEGAGDGILIRSTNGSRWLFRLDDSGTPASVRR